MGHSGVLSLHVQVPLEKLHDVAPVLRRSEQAFDYESRTWTQN